jgi:hypothetical protein
MQRERRADLFLSRYAAAWRKGTDIDKVSHRHASSHIYLSKRKEAATWRSRAPFSVSVPFEGGGAAAAPSSSSPPAPAAAAAAAAAGAVGDPPLLLTAHSLSGARTVKVKSDVDDDGPRGVSNSALAATAAMLRMRRPSCRVRVYLH